MKDYYPYGYEPLHAVTDWAYLRKMIRTLRTGGKFPPVYVLQGTWMSGMHRVSAAQIRAELDGTNWEDDLEIVSLDDTYDALSEEQMQEYLERDEYEDKLKYLLCCRG